MLLLAPHNSWHVLQEVDKQLAQRSAKKLELALESEKQYTKQLEKVSCTASQISCDASARAHDMEDKVRNARGGDVDGQKTRDAGQVMSARFIGGSHTSQTHMHLRPSAPF